MNNSERIEALRNLLSLVVENTKREIQGKGGNTKKEESLISKNLAYILGREPNAQEISRAKQFA